MSSSFLWRMKRQKISKCLTLMDHIAFCSKCPTMFSGNVELLFNLSLDIINRTFSMLPLHSFHLTGQSFFYINTLYSSGIFFLMDYNVVVNNTTNR